MKFLRNLFKILGSILLIVVAAICILKAYGYLSFRSFYKNAEKITEIPGLGDSFVPQGLCLDGDDILVCGYSKDNKSSVYVKDKDGNERRILMLDMEGKNCQDHFGGITTSGDYLYLSGGDGSSNGHQFVYTYLKSEVLAKKDEESVKPISTSDVATGTAFLYATDALLYVGEFNHNGSAYDIQDETHHVTLGGESHKAIMLAYSINSDGSLSQTPQSAYSIPDDIQGFTMGKNSICYMSASWSINPSHLYMYSFPTEKVGTLEVNGNSVPLMFFKNSDLKRDVKTSPMLEGICYSEGYVYTLNESSSYKYIFGNLFRGSSIYAYKA